MFRQQETTGPSHLAIASDGSIYVAGADLLSKTGTESLSVLRWDGDGWHSLGSLSGQVFDLALLNNTDPVVMGSLSRAGEVSIQNIARWTEAGWESMGGGLPEPIRAHATTRDGTFAVGGGSALPKLPRTSTMGLMVWEGDHWTARDWKVFIQALATDSEGSFWAIAAKNGTNYLGRLTSLSSQFERVETVAYWAHVAEHDQGAVLYVEGPSTAVAYTGLESLDETFGTPGWPRVHRAGTRTLVSITRNDSTWIEEKTAQGWRTIGPPLTGELFDLDATPEGKVVATGRFILPDQQYTGMASLWEGDWTAWPDLTPRLGIEGRVLDLAADGNGRVLVGGSFPAAGDLAVGNLAEWNGRSWEHPGIEFESRVSAVLSDEHGALVASECDVWQRSASGGWSQLDRVALAGDETCFLRSLFRSREGEVYVGGMLSDQAFRRKGFLAKLNGESWIVVAATDESNEVRNIWAMVEAPDGSLVLGGEFDRIGDVDANNVVRWDGNQFLKMSSGLSGSVGTLAFFNGELYAGGRFRYSGSTPIANLARWSGAAWAPLGLGLSGGASHLAVGPDGLYVIGRFDWADQLRADGMAVWDGSGFKAIPGASPAGKAVFDHEGVMYVSSARNAGGWGETAFTFWRPGSVPETGPEPAPRANVELFPLPTDGEVFLEPGGVSFSSIAVYDLLGRRINAPVEISPNGGQIRVDLEAFASGLYVLLMTAEQGTVSRVAVKR